MILLPSHKIRAEIDRLELIVHELDRGPCTESLIERIGDIGATLCEIADGHYSGSLMFPPTDPPKRDTEPPTSEPEKEA